MAYLTPKEKSLLFAALTKEEKVCKENGFPELVPVVQSLHQKFKYDRYEVEIRNKTIEEIITKLLPYGSLCAEWNDGMLKEEIAESVLNQAKEQFIDILEGLRNTKINMTV